MSDKFLLCVPDYAKGLMWCKHHNGNWAPPFPISTQEKPQTNETFQEEENEQV